MYFYFIFLNCLLHCICANVDNDIIVEYFTYKRISRIIGYSCNNVKDDLVLMRQLNDKGIAALISKLSDKSSIGKIANTRYWKLGIFLDIRCYTFTNIFEFFTETTEYRMYDELRDWFILGNKLEDILNVINDKAFGLSTNFFIAIMSNGGFYKLYDVYNIHKSRGTLLNVTFYGSWSTQNNFIIDLVQPKLARRSNFHNLRLKVAFYKTVYKPQNMTQVEYYEDSKGGIKEALSKYGYIIWKHLGDLYNFSIDCFETEALKADDFLGSLVRSLIDTRADLGGTPLSMTANRSYFIKYIHMGLPLRTCFIFRNPQPMEVKIQEIFRPFANSVWYFTCFTILAIILIFSFTIGDDQRDTMMNLSTSFIITIAAVCQQGIDMHLHNFSSRIVFLFSLLFSLLLYNYYSTCIVSVRLDEPIYKINDSLVELGKLRLKMASEKITYLNLFFKAFSTWELKIFYENYWMKILEDTRYIAPEIGMRLVQQGGFAYHVHPDLGYLFIEKHFSNREICELMEVHLGRPNVNMFTVSNNCTFTELLRVGLTKISEVGLRRRQVDKWRLKKPECRKDILSASSINIYEFASHLILLFMGMLASIYVFLIEIIHFKWGFGLRTTGHFHQRSDPFFADI